MRCLSYEHMFEQTARHTHERITGGCEVVDAEPTVRTRRGLHDMSHDNVITAPRGRDSHDDLSCALAEIEGRLEQLEGEIAAIAPLVHERERLLRAKAIILGEPEPRTVAQMASRRITREAVFDYLTRHPGARAGEIASGLGVGQGAVSAHLYRGKEKLFASRGGRWFPVPAADPA
jgi:hypothetical protein